MTVSKYMDTEITANQCWKLGDAPNLSVLVKKLSPPLVTRTIKGEIKAKKMDDLRREDNREKEYNI